MYLSAIFGIVAQQSTPHIGEQDGLTLPCPTGRSAPRPDPLPHARQGNAGWQNCHPDQVAAIYAEEGVQENASMLGREYANGLDRHFRVRG